MFKLAYENQYLKNCFQLNVSDFSWSVTNSSPE